jgi:hypothetical protein
MHRTTCLAWFSLLAALALWPAGCSQPTGTFVKLNFTGAVNKSQPIHSITVDLQFDGTTSTATTTFQMPNGAEIHLDTSSVLEIGHGQGPLTVIASALASDGALLGTGSGWGTVVRDKTTEIAVTFAEFVPDAGVDAMPPADGPAPGLDGVVDITTRDTLDAAADVPVNPDAPVAPDTVRPVDVGAEAAGGADGGPDAPSLGGAGGAGGTTTGGSGGAGGIAAGGAGGTGSGGSTGGYVLTANPTSIDFGVVPPGSTAGPKAVTITNIGDTATPPLTLVLNDATKAFVVSSDLCSNRILPPQATCAVEFKFVPTTTGSQRADVSVQPATGGMGAKLSLTGTGAGGAASLSLSPPTVSLGTVDVGTNVSVDFTLTNGGDTDAGSITVTVSGSNAFQITNPGCSNRVLGPRSQCVFTVTFAPTTYGPVTASIKAQSSLGLSANAAISGTGRDYVPLNLAVEGNGVVTGGPESCTGPKVCTFSISRTDPTLPLTFNLAAQPLDNLWLFSGWSGDCSANTSCSVVMNNPHSVTATFTPRMVTLNLTVLSLAGHAGMLVSDDGSVSCKEDCPNLQVPAAASFTLHANPASGSTFAGWTTGPDTCKGIASKCSFALTDTVTISATFGPQNYMFVSSSVRAPGTWTSIAVADAECAKLAENAKLPGTYVAWLSTTAVKAGSRIGEGGWVRTDGRPFARDLKSLIDPASYSVFYPPRLDENATDLGVGGKRILVATGTLPDGTFSGSNCKDFTDSSTAPSLTTGDAAAGSFAWTSNSVENGVCASARRLYCFRKDLGPVQLNPPPQTGRRVFISTNPFIMKNGLTPTEQCRKDADGGGISDPANFVAFIATTSTPALRLVKPDGPPWRRMDGVFVTQLPTDFANGKLLAPIDVMADGKTYSNANVWTGATDPSAPGTQTCGDWTGSGSSTGGIVGDSQTTVSPPWFDLTSIPCNSASATAHLYCIEQ